MVYTYGCIDLIVKSSVLERNNYGGVRKVGKLERIKPGYYDAEIVCFPLGMIPVDAKYSAERLASLYHFSLPNKNNANNSDSVVVGDFMATGECDWIEEIGNGAYQMKSNIREWDAEKWLADFRIASANRDTHAVRAAVYKHTQELSERESYRINGKTVNIDSPDASVMYDKEIILPDNIAKNPDKVKFEVYNEDCLSVARRLQNENPLVLNMANRQTPGGGVIYGAGAQEECLFRSSNYYKSLYAIAEKYPMDRNFGGSYTSNVTVFRDLEEKGYPLLEEPFKTSFVAVAAMRNPDLNADGHLTVSHRNGTRNKIRTILNIAILHGHTTLILSALGCGAFHNPPEDIALLFREALESEPYAHYFKKAIFGIKSDHNDKSNSNFKAFQNVFKE